MNSRMEGKGAMRIALFLRHATGITCNDTICNQFSCHNCADQCSTTNDPHIIILKARKLQFIILLPFILLATNPILRSFVYTAL
jgi:hypothetical protein